MFLASVPARWEDISPAWMTSVLAAEFPGVEVASVSVSAEDTGTNRRGRARLTYQRGQGPETVFLKGHSPDHMDVHLRNGNFFLESRLLASKVDLGVERPKTYAALWARQPPAFLVVMEDVVARGGDPLDATRPMNVKQVADGLRSLARMHSRFWSFDASSHPHLNWVETWAAHEGWQVGLRARIPIGLNRGASFLPPEVSALTGDQVVALWARYVSTLSGGPQTLLHADAHIGNTYALPGDRIGFLDWQVVRSGEWSQDVGYFLVSALTEEDRRRHERSLIETYREALDVPSGERPSAEDAWNRYCASAAYGQAIWLSTLGTDGWQSRAVCELLARRFATAFVELDTMSALAQV